MLGSEPTDTADVREPPAVENPAHSAIHFIGHPPCCEVGIWLRKWAGVTTVTVLAGRECDVLRKFYGNLLHIIFMKRHIESRKKSTFKPSARPLGEPNLLIRSVKSSVGLQTLASQVLTNPASGIIIAVDNYGLL